MGIELAIMFVISIGLAYLAAKLLAPKQAKPNYENKPTTLSERGTFIPWVMGRRRIGYAFGHAWGREIRKEDSPGGGGGKKGGGDDDAQQVDVYWEYGWHILGIGPAHALHKIYQNGKIIFSGTTRAASPSGTSINLGKEGIFTIYWGDQVSADSTLAAQLGVDSYWPKICFIVWKKKRLDMSAIWPNIEYEIEVRPDNHSSIFPGTVTLGNGMDPAHCVAEMLFADWPWGVGVDPDDWDLDSLQEISTEAQALNIPASFMAADGQEAGSLLGAFLQDHSCFLPLDPTTGKLKFRRIRSPAETGETVYQIKQEMQVDPLPEITTMHGEKNMDRMIFVFPCRTHRFKDMTIGICEDGQADYLQHARAKRIGLSTVVDFEAASVLAERRSQEELAGGSSYKIYANHGARTLVPGDACVVEGIEEGVRITSVDVNPQSTKVTLQAISDIFGIKASDYLHPETGGEPSFDDPEEGLAVGFVEMPEVLYPGLLKIFGMCMHIRANASVAGVHIHVSDSEFGSYSFVATQTIVHTGGTLLEALNATDLMKMDSGPLISDLGPDTALVVDQSEEHWRVGRQVMIAGNEVMYIDKMTAVSGDYRLEGILRARLGTERETHSIGDPVFIFPYSNVYVISDLLFIPGDTIWIKLQPYSGAGAIPLDDVSAFSHTLEGRGISAPRIPNLYQTDPHPCHSIYTEAADITFKWSWFAPASPFTGAGQFTAGTPGVAGELDGNFFVEITDASDNTKREFTTTDPEYTYSAANMYSDFSSTYPTSFKIKVSHIRNGYQGEINTLVITKE